MFNFCLKAQSLKSVISLKNRQHASQSWLSMLRKRDFELRCPIARVSRTRESKLAINLTKKGVRALMSHYTRFAHSRVKAGYQCYKRRISSSDVHDTRLLHLRFISGHYTFSEANRILAHAGAVFSAVGRFGPAYQPELSRWGKFTCLYYKSLPLTCIALLAAKLCSYVCATPATKRLGSKFSVSFNRGDRTSLDNAVGFCALCCRFCGSLMASQPYTPSFWYSTGVKHYSSCFCRTTSPNGVSSL